MSGNELFGTIGGIPLAANGLAPAMSNAVCDFARSYDLVLWAILLLLAITAMLFLSLGDYPESPNSAVRTVQD
ncbi:MAG: hypothetical protein ACKOPO_02455 [Novosphingobium sp.]